MTALCHICGIRSRVVDSQVTGNLECQAPVGLCYPWPANRWIRPSFYLQEKVAPVKITYTHLEN